MEITGKVSGIPIGSLEEWDSTSGNGREKAKPGVGLHNVIKLALYAIDYD